MPRPIKKNLPSSEPTTPPQSPSIEKAQAKNDYIEIRLPKVRFQDTPLSPLWVMLLIIFAFLLGMTTTKIQYLQKGGNDNNLAAGQGGNQPQQPTLDDVKQWAKDLRLSNNQFDKCVADAKFQSTIDKDIQDAITASAEATPTFYVNGVRLVGAQPIENFRTVIDNELNGTRDQAALVADVEHGKLPSMGKKDAPVTIVEFSDFQCPFCKQFIDTTYPQLKKEYIDTGKVALYYRHLPLVQLHPMAMTFSHAAECANEQGKFWEMHDKIFSEQG